MHQNVYKDPLIGCAVIDELRLSTLAALKDTVSTALDIYTQIKPNAYRKWL